MREDTRLAQELDINEAGVRGVAKFGGECAICGSMWCAIENFKSITNVREYSISGMCQDCQDEVFK